VATIGREPSNDIFLDAPEVQERRLISRLHAHLRGSGGEYRLFDGGPDGKPSANGTYINYRRVPPEGAALQNGDVIILGAVNPADPRPETPGAAALQFWVDCKG
jgi:pSer/pThr/pTyr-binding forkhead associated (FHA) protein